MILSSPNDNNRSQGFNNRHHNRGGYGRHGHDGNDSPRGPSGFRNRGGAPLGPRHGLPANQTKHERERERVDREAESSIAESEGVERVHGHGSKRILTDVKIGGMDWGVIGWEWGILDRVKDKDGDDEQSADETKFKEEPTLLVKPIISAKTPQPALRTFEFFNPASDPEADTLSRKRKKDADDDTGNRSRARSSTSTVSRGTSSPGTCQ